tara:strand:- start:1095 stop:1298 length:204 start_codon:yes stop_codon:yes gene_type:complete
MATVVIIDALTGETVEREQTEAELAQAKADQAEAKARAKAEADKATAKEVVLMKLGLTADEVAALLS